MGDSKLETNSSSLSNTPQKCASAINMDTPVCSEIRNPDKKTGKLNKNILQKNAKNLLQNNMDTINDEDESFDIFCKKRENSSNIKDQNVSSGKYLNQSEQIKTCEKYKKLENKEVSEILKEDSKSKKENEILKKEV